MRSPSHRGQFGRPSHRRRCGYPSHRGQFGRPSHGGKFESARPEIKSADSPHIRGSKEVAVLINIDKTKQTMTVSVDGVETYEWPVSTGKAGYSTPSGTYTATSMNEIWYSKQWDNAPMPHSIFFMKDGHAIHGSLDVKDLGKPVSHGCVRISPENAATLYTLVARTAWRIRRSC